MLNNNEACACVCKSCSHNGRTIVPKQVQGGSEAGIPGSHCYIVPEVGGRKLCTHVRAVVNDCHLVTIAVSKLHERGGGRSHCR